MAGKHAVAMKTIFYLIISFLCISHLYNHLSAGQDVSSDNIAISKPASASRPKATARKAVPGITHKRPEIAPPLVDTDKDALLQQRAKDARDAREKVSGVSPSGITASIIRVPADYPTIQKALEAAVDGDIILVSPGTYYETVHISKDITLKGENKETTIINGKTGGYRVYGIYISSDSNKGHVSGFTISGFVNGVSFSNSEDKKEWVLTNNIIKNNKEVGIRCIMGGNSNNLLIADNLIETNGKGGIVVENSGAGIDITNNSIIKNKGNGVDIFASDGMKIIPICNQDDTMLYSCHGGVTWQELFISVRKKYIKPVNLERMQQLQQSFARHYLCC